MLNLTLIMIDDCRGFVRELKKQRKLKKVRVQVDRNWEIGCIARKVMEFRPDKRFAILFEKIKGFKFPVFINGFASTEMYAIGLGTTVDGVQETWQSALQRPVEPELASTGACKENILLGESIDLNIFPHIVSTPKKESAPYITGGCVVMKDPETGIGNVGVYRCMFKGKDKLGIHMAPISDGGIIYSKYERLNRPMEVAIAIGPPPTVYSTAIARVPFGVDELAVAGGLMHSPLKIVKCETVDLEVPANSEIVIEGEVQPKYRESEGPFGEFYGYMGEEIMSPVVYVTAITYRNNPIYQSLLQQNTPNEGTLCKDMGMEVILMNTFKSIGILAVTDVHVRERSSGECVVLAINNAHPEQVRLLAQACWATYPISFKQVIVVDSDCNVRDYSDVEWRMSTCVQPERDIHVFNNCAASALDPSVQKDKRKQGSKLCIDATRKINYPEVALPPKSMLDKAEKRWKKYGLSE